MSSANPELLLSRWLRATSRGTRYTERTDLLLPVPRYVQAGIRYGLTLGLDDAAIITAVLRGVTPPPRVDQIRSALTIAHRRPIVRSPLSLTPGAARVVTERHSRLALTLTSRALTNQDSPHTPAALATARRALLIIGVKALDDIDAGFDHPIVTAGWLARGMGLSERRARDVIRRLTGLGWLALHKTVARKGWPVYRVVRATDLPADRFEATVAALAAGRPDDDATAASLMLAGHPTISYGLGRPDRASQVWLADVARAAGITNEAGRALGIAARPAADRKRLADLAATHGTLAAGLAALAGTPEVVAAAEAAATAHRLAAVTQAAARAPFERAAARSTETAAMRSAARRWLLRNTGAGWLDRDADAAAAHAWLVRVAAGIAAHDADARTRGSRKRPLADDRRQLLAGMVASDLRRVGVLPAVAVTQAAAAVHIPAPGKERAA